jgi:hypothetical protein
MAIKMASRQASKKVHCIQLNIVFHAERIVKEPLMLLIIKTSTLMLCG